VDVGDAFARAYDALEDTPGTQLLIWLGTREVSEAAKEVAAEAFWRGQVADWRLPGPFVASADTLGVLLGVHRALLHVDPDRNTQDRGALGGIWTRYLLSDKPRLNLETDGAVLFAHSIATRPNPRDAPDTVADMVPGLIRVPEDLWRRANPVLVPAHHDLTPGWTVKVEDGQIRIGRRPIRTAQLPFLARRSDVRWRVVTDPRRPGAARYAVDLNRPAVKSRIPAALVALDASRSQLAVLPEAALDDTLLDRWRTVLRTRRRQPPGGLLRWLLIGTGPVTRAGSTPPNVGCPPNRAVLVHRDGTVLLTQDKRRGFTLDAEQQRRYGLAKQLGGESPLGEHLWQGTTFSYLEGQAGRFAIAICEDHGRLIERTARSTSDFVARLGVTHLLVPVIAPAMWHGGWQAKAACEIADAVGASVLVSNSCAIDQFATVGGGSAAATLVAAIPQRRPSEIRRSSRLLLRPCSGTPPPTSPRANALTVRRVWL